MRTIKRDIVGALIESADGKFLLAKNRPGGVYPDCYLVPGGGVNEGETKQAALIREMLEETGIDLTGLPLTLVNDTDLGSQEKTLVETGETVLVDMTFNTWHVKLDQPASATAIIDNTEIFSGQWFEKSELANLKLSPPTKHVCEILGLI